MLEWGYKEVSVLFPKNCDSYIVTDFMGSDGDIASLTTPFTEYGDRRLYKTIPEFLTAVKEIAVRKLWFKETNSHNMVGEIDWEQRRYEIACSCMVAYKVISDAKDRAKWAVEDADALIQELKNKNKIQ